MKMGHNNKNSKNNIKNDGANVEGPKAEECKCDEKLLDETVNIAKKEYEELKVKAAERDAMNDKYVRAHAEFENVRKRMEKDKADFARYASESLVLDLLPIIDNLEIAEKHIKEAKDFKAVRDGVDMIQLQMQSFLKDIGLERMKTIGVMFDPHLHDPIETAEAADKADGLIIDELKPGYTFKGKLLRPASVRIVKNNMENKE